MDAQTEPERPDPAPEEAPAAASPVPSPARPALADAEPEPSYSVTDDEDTEDEGIARHPSQDAAADKDAVAMLLGLSQVADEDGSPGRRRKRALSAGPGGEHPNLTRKGALRMGPGDNRVRPPKAATKLLPEAKWRHIRLPDVQLALEGEDLVVMWAHFKYPDTLPRSKVESLLNYRIQHYDEAELRRLLEPIQGALELENALKERYGVGAAAKRVRTVNGGGFGASRSLPPPAHQPSPSPTRPRAPQQQAVDTSALGQKPAAPSPIKAEQQDNGRGPTTAAAAADTRKEPQSLAEMIQDWASLDPALLQSLKPEEAMAALTAVTTSRTTSNSAPPVSLPPPGLDATALLASMQMLQPGLQGNEGSLPLSLLGPGNWGSLLSGPLAWNLLSGSAGGASTGAQQQQRDEHDLASLLPSLLPGSSTAFGAQLASLGLAAPAAPAAPSQPRASGKSKGKSAASRAAPSAPVRLPAVRRPSKGSADRPGRPPSYDSMVRWCVDLKRCLWQHQVTLTIEEAVQMVNDPSLCARPPSLEGKAKLLVASTLRKRVLGIYKITWSQVATDADPDAALEVTDPSVLAAAGTKLKRHGMDPARPRTGAAGMQNGGGGHAAAAAAAMHQLAAAQALGAIGPAVHTAHTAGGKTVVGALNPTAAIASMPAAFTLTSSCVPNLPQNVRSLLDKASTRFLSSQEVIELLKGAAAAGLPISARPAHLPPPGSLFLFSRGRTPRFTADGVSWKGKEREATVSGLACRHVGAAPQDKLHRRCYWLAAAPGSGSSEPPNDLVLVHYLRSSAGEALSSDWEDAGSVPVEEMPAAVAPGNGKDDAALHLASAAGARAAPAPPLPPQALRSGPMAQGMEIEVRELAPAGGPAGVPAAAPAAAGPAPGYRSSAPQPPPPPPPPTFQSGSDAFDPHQVLAGAWAGAALAAQAAAGGAGAAALGPPVPVLDAPSLGPLPSLDALERALASNPSSPEASLLVAMLQGAVASSPSVMAAREAKARFKRLLAEADTKDTKSMLVPLRELHCVTGLSAADAAALCLLWTSDALEDAQKRQLFEYIKSNADNDLVLAEGVRSLLAANRGDAPALP